MPASAVQHHIRESPSRKTADGDRYDEVKRSVDGAKTFLGMEMGLKSIPENWNPRRRCFCKAKGLGNKEIQHCFTGHCSALLKAGVKATVKRLMVLGASPKGMECCHSFCD